MIPFCRKCHQYYFELPCLSGNSLSVRPYMQRPPSVPVFAGELHVGTGLGSMPRHNKHKKRTAAQRRRNRGDSIDGADATLPAFVDGRADEHYYYDKHDPFAHGSFGDAFFAVGTANTSPV